MLILRGRQRTRTRRMGREIDNKFIFVHHCFRRPSVYYYVSPVAATLLLSLSL